MNRRDFNKQMLMLGIGAHAGSAIAKPVQAGNFYEEPAKKLPVRKFDVIVAVILGGTSLSGGEGSMIGTLIGALIVGVLGNGLNLLGVQTFYQYVASGAVLIIAVLLDTTLKGQGINRETLRRLIHG